MTEPSRSHQAHGRKLVIVFSLGMLILSFVISFIVLDFSFDYNARTNQKNQNATNTQIPEQSNSLMKKSFIDVIDTNEDIHRFNAEKLLRLLQQLVTKNYFKYFRVNLYRPCALWCNDGTCHGKRMCQVETEECPKLSDELATVDTELASDISDHPIKPFECNDDDDDHDLQYVDLCKNPEQFTNYSGESAHRIWRAIYDENCFLKQNSIGDQCYEKQIFYEAISGLHSSINIHLCAAYPTDVGRGKHKNRTLALNLAEFRRRFENHPEYLKNLYKLYQLELKALTRCKSHLLKQIKWPDPLLKDEIQNLLNTIEKFKIPSLFDVPLKPNHELADNFKNITKIMDCVACAKCKLWGKVQLRGLGTAFNILSMNEMSKLYLNHQDIVSLINSIARLSHSIAQLEEFKNLELNSSNSGRRDQATSRSYNANQGFFTAVNLNK